MTALLLALLLSVSPAAGSPPPEVPVETDLARWTGPDGEILPFRDDDEVLEFLRTADVVSDEPIRQGISNSRKLLLDKDGVQAHAVFRTVARHSAPRRPDRKLRFAARDSCTFESAAYELNRLLGMHRVPPAVEREYGGAHGSLQIWVENAIDEGTRREEGLLPPDPDRWEREERERLVFDALIANRDRNLGNLLVERDTWKVWLIDHTRSFPPERALEDPDRIQRCDRRLWNALRTADRQVVQERLAPYLTGWELRSLFIRWDRLVDHIQERIDERGEDAVLDGPGGGRRF